MEGFECQARWFGTCVGSSGESLELPGGGAATVRGALSEESGRCSQRGLERGKREHGKAGEPGRRGQGPE